MPIIKRQALSKAAVYPGGWRSCESLGPGRLPAAIAFTLMRIRSLAANTIEEAGVRAAKGIESFWSFTKLRLAKLRAIQADAFTSPPQRIRVALQSSTR